MKYKKTAGTILAFAVMILLLTVLFFASVNIGSLKVGVPDILQGMIGKGSEEVSTVFDLRLPRIFISILAGAATAVSGVLFQAVLKNPLADPGIIGISSGATFAAILITAFAPTLFFFTPVFAFFGGVLAFCLVYTLSWKGGLSPLRVILTGVAVNAMFTGLSSGLNSMNGGNMSVVLAGMCDILSLEDKTARSLGVNVNLMRILISLVAVLLAAISAAVAGSISFLGLIVPHMGRILVGSEHKKLLPFSMLLGAFLFLLADTAGRTIAAPYEISA